MSQQHARARTADPGPPICGAEDTEKLRAATPAFAVLLGGRGFANPDTASPSCERPVTLALAATPHSIDNGPADQRALKAYRPRERFVWRSPRFVAESLAQPPRIGRFKLQHLGDKNCHFPVTKDAPFLFCGKPKPEDESVPYCGGCSAIAYRGS